MKPNYIGIVGAIIAFISLALPWWTVSASYLGTGVTYNWNLYDAGTYGTGMNLWYNWVAILLVVLAGIVGLAGSIMQNGKKILMGGGLLAVLALIIFPVGLQMDLSSTNAPVGLFSSTSVSGISYSTYLSFGFWLALVSAIIMLVAAMRTTKTSPTPSPVLPTPTS